MRKWVVLVVLMLAAVSTGAASILTNTNQSATFLRLLSRNPSLDIDAVYYNPAGLTKLADGWHFALHNQTISQEKTVIDHFPLLRNDTYVGKTEVPFFPNVYAVYKKDRLALSLGFGPNGGGGSAEYATGLPSFETSIAMVPLMLSGMGLPTSAYSADIFFKGSSIFLGFQGNVSYALTDTIAVAGGFRYVQAKNTYEGYIRDIKINPAHPYLNPGGGMVSAPQFFTMIGQPGYAAMLSDMTVDAEQTGSGITPILSVNVGPVQGFNFSVKYEANTKLELKNATARDDTGMFPDGATSPNDIPAILSLGASYEILPSWRAIVSYNLFFDKNADWGGEEDLIDKNTFELALGTEFDLSPAVTLSAGYQRTQFGLSEAWQSDQAFELSADSLAVGARLRFIRNLDIDLGLLNAFYIDGQKNFPSALGPYREDFKKTTVGFAIGLGFHI